MRGNEIGYRLSANAQQSPQLVPSDVVLARVGVALVWTGVISRAAISFFSPIHNLVGSIIKAALVTPITVLNGANLFRPSIWENSTALKINALGFVGGLAAVVGSTASAVGEGLDSNTLRAVGSGLEFCAPCIFSAIAGLDLTTRTNGVDQAVVVAQPFGMAIAGGGGALISSNPTLGAIVAVAGLGIAGAGAAVDAAKSVIDKCHCVNYKPVWSSEDVVEKGQSPLLSERSRLLPGAEHSTNSSP